MGGFRCFTVLGTHERPSNPLTGSWGPGEIWGEGGSVGRHTVQGPACRSEGEAQFACVKAGPERYTLIPTTSQQGEGNATRTLKKTRSKTKHKHTIKPVKEKLLPKFCQNLAKIHKSCQKEKRQKYLHTPSVGRGSGESKGAPGRTGAWTPLKFITQGLPVHAMGSTMLVRRERRRTRAGRRGER